MYVAILSPQASNVYTVNISMNLRSTLIPNGLANRSSSGNASRTACVYIPSRWRDVQTINSLAIYVQVKREIGHERENK